MSAFFFSLKNFFKAISTASWHLSIPGLSIELFSFFLSQSRQLLDSSLIHRASFWLWTPKDTCSIAASVDPFKAQHLLIPLDLSRITKLLYIGSAWFRPHFARSLLISLDFSPSKTSLSHSKLHPQGFFWPRSSFSSLDKGPNPPFSFISCIWPNFLGFFFEKLEFFKIDEVIVKILGYGLWKWF